MANKNKQKQFKIGEQLFIARTPGKFEMVDGFFNNRQEAMRYYLKNYLGCSYQIKGLRFSSAPIGLVGGDTRVVSKK